MIQVISFTYLSQIATQSRFDFAPTSKTIYALSNDFRDEHNAMKARFSSIAHRKDDIKNRPADTLRELLLNPRAALYVRDVLIDDWYGRFDCLGPAGACIALTEWGLTRGRCTISSKRYAFKVPYSERIVFSLSTRLNLSIIKSMCAHEKSESETTKDFMQSSGPIDVAQTSTSFCLSQIAVQNRVDFIRTALT